MYFIYVNPKKTLNLFHRMCFHFLQNFCQLCLVTCSANILKLDVFREVAIKTLT